MFWAFTKSLDLFLRPAPQPIVKKLQMWKKWETIFFSSPSWRILWAEVCTVQAVAPEAERSQAFPAFLTVFLNIGGVAAFAFLVRYVLQTLDMDQWCCLPIQVKETALQRSEKCPCNAVVAAFSTQLLINAVELSGNCCCNTEEPRWKLPLQHRGTCPSQRCVRCLCNLVETTLQLSGICLCNLAETSFATQKKLPLQPGGICLCNLVESAFATWWKLVLQIASQWKLALQHSGNCLCNAVWKLGWNLIAMELWHLWQLQTAAICQIMLIVVHCTSPPLFEPSTQESIFIFLKTWVIFWRLYSDHGLSRTP